MKRIKGTGKAGGETASKKGGSEASAGKPDNGLDAERARLQEKYPMEWTVSEVAKWLDCIDMGQYKMVFIENSISGAELFELDPEDLASINVRKLGHRKTILKKISMLKKNMKGAFQSNTESMEDDDSSSGGSISGASGNNSAKTSKDKSESKRTLGGKVSKGSANKDSGDEVSFKCFYDDDVRVIKMKGKLTFTKLQRKIKEEYHEDLIAKFKDNDGDLLPIVKAAHIRAAVREADGRAVRLHLFDHSAQLSAMGAAHTLLLENLVEACIVINRKGIILFFNEAAEEMFGYRRKQVLGKNVKMLMPSETAAAHDSYIKSYLATGEGRVMNSGRKVIAKKKDRSTFPTFLSVSEANLGENEHFFVGMMKDLSTVKSAEAVRMHDFSLLDGILDVAIVINEAGTIQFFNKSAEKLLGYERMEVLGKNVNMLMPPPFHDEHDTYLRNYLTTGVAKVLGTGRDVLAQCKDGKILQVHLSITEQGVTGEKRFTGILRPTVEKKGVEKSVLQEEREVLDNLLVAAIIIDSNALIHGFNQPASALLGYSLIEVVGKNVKMFMANPEKSKHDTYVQNYLKGGRPKVLGKGRDVVAVHKDGTMIPVHLSVTERREEDKRYFTGILQKL